MCSEEIRKICFGSMQLLRSGISWVILGSLSRASSLMGHFLNLFSQLRVPLPNSSVNEHADSLRESNQAPFNIQGMDYKPHVQKVLHHSRNAVVARLECGVVLKYSRYAWWEHPESGVVKEAKHAFEVEATILKALGRHPRIIEFLGPFEPQGLRFVEADFGSLQSFIDNHFEKVSAEEKLQWRRQATEAIVYIHGKGVIHSDLRPENFLLYLTTEGSKSVRLCDFGGSVFGDLDGGHLPDAGFFDPRKPWESTEQTDIFSLGSVFYTVMEGHWPHWTKRGFTADEHDHYSLAVDDLFRNSDFPPVDYLEGGLIIRGCWDDEYNRAADILEDHDRLLVLT